MGMCVRVNLFVHVRGWGDQTCLIQFESLLPGICWSLCHGPDGWTHSHTLTNSQTRSHTQHSLS